MTVVFAGAERPNVLHTLAEAGVKDIMISYASGISENCWRLIREYGFNEIMDSGAFTMWKQGKEINIADYIAYIKKYQVKRYFNLDVVGDPQRTMDNQREMEKAGLSPIPVFHFGGPLELLDELVEKYDLVGLGGHVGRKKAEVMRWFAEVFDRHPGARFHGLGATVGDMMQSFPFHSVDSSWWLFKIRGGAKRHAPGGTRKEEQLARIEHLRELTRRNQGDLFLHSSNSAC